MNERAMRLRIGLFVLVAGIGQTGLIAALTEGLQAAAHAAPRATAWGAGALVAGSTMLPRPCRATVAA